MKQTIRLTLLLSATALFTAACAPVPFENQSTASNTYTAPAPTPVSSTVAAPVPEAGPLSEVAAAPAPQTTAATVTVTVPAATATPVATVPQVPAATNTGSSYDTYAASNTHSSGTTYDYSGGGANSYTTYNNSTASANTYAANTNTNNYYSGGNDSYTGGSNSYAAANSSGAGGTAAVQIFATVSQAKAERIRQDVSSQGLQAIVDQVDGLYKVRIPYPTASQARANLTRVRHVSGTPGAFVTTR